MNLYNPQNPPPINGLASSSAGQRTAWKGLTGSASGLAIARFAEAYQGLVLVVTRDSAESYKLESEIRFYRSDTTLEVLIFPDWETLVYDPLFTTPGHYIGTT